MQALFSTDACIPKDLPLQCKHLIKGGACMVDEKDKDESKVAGGLARAKALTPARESQIAAKAAAARWGKLPRATHRGNFKEDFGIDVDCYVLDDEQKTAVLSQRGIGAAMGLQGASGQAFLRLANGQRLAPFIGLEL